MPRHVERPLRERRADGARGESAGRQPSGPRSDQDQTQRAHKRGKREQQERGRSYHPRRERARSRCRHERWRNAQCERNQKCHRRQKRGVPRSLGDNRCDRAVVIGRVAEVESQQAAEPSSPLDEDRLIQLRARACAAASARGRAADHFRRQRVGGRDARDDERRRRHDKHENDRGEQASNQVLEHQRLDGPGARCAGALYSYPVSSSTSTQS